MGGREGILSISSTLVNRNCLNRKSDLNMSQHSGWFTCGLEQKKGGDIFSPRGAGIEESCVNEGLE